MTFQVKYMTGDQSTLLDQNFNICDLTEKGVSNLFLKRAFDIATQQLTFQFKCPFKKVSSLSNI